MKQIYISFTHRDRRYMQNLRDHLEQAGYRVTYNKEMGQGVGWNLQVADSIRRSALCVPILTSDGAESTEVTYEWAFALGCGVAIYPVIFRGVTPHPHLMVVEGFDFGSHPEEERAWLQYVREAQRIIGDEQTITATSISGKVPVVSTRSLPDQNRRGSNESMEFYLLIQQSGEQHEFPMRSASISLGRGDQNDIQIVEDGVSRSHLRFIRNNDGYQVIDVGSTNGTYKAGSDDRIEALMLKPGDVLTIGENVILTYNVR